MALQNCEQLQAFFEGRVITCRPHLRHALLPDDQGPAVGSAGYGPRRPEPNSEVHARLQRGPEARCSGDGEGNTRGDGGVGLGGCGMTTGEPHPAGAQGGQLNAQSFEGAHLEAAM